MKSALGRLADPLIYLILSALALITLYPFIYVLVASVSEPVAVMKHQGLLFWPLGFTLKAYDYVFENPMILKGYQNTLLYVSLGTCINMLMTSLGAYALSRRYLRVGNWVMLMIVFTMFFSGGLIPSYLNVKSLGMQDTVWALVIPSAINTFNLIVMRTAFRGVPDSMEESAKIDGANDFIILFRIFIPLVLPLFTVILLFYLVQHWNSWFPAMIYLRTREMYPVQLILREILISSSTETMTSGVSARDSEPIGETIKYATIMVVCIPIICVYPFLQKYFTKGIMVGAIKE
ncbi:carbohydrate ABC transporter permease [Paenibacillus thalictri]|uniref:Carbohydrate ABC transporter permease n=1 Tax=Paenibacillus thalictri TaxID=2527873 RepID=A0A4Q9DPT3_9BACL|nr:carbohydrate ABC transporter permease [Paenibacillus thalictri]TBL76658.1 carbohydrate ABC transporter permease [Paenibacillus thalictri]